MAFKCDNAIIAKPCGAACKVIVMLETCCDVAAGSDDDPARGLHTGVPACPPKCEGGQFLQTSSTQLLKTLLETAAEPKDMLNGPLCRGALVSW